MTRPIFFLLLLLFSTSIQSQVIEIASGKQSYSNTPVFVKLPKPYAANKSYQLKNKQTGNVTPAQLLDSVTLVFVLTDNLPAGKTIQYDLISGPMGAQYGFINKPIITIHEEKDGVWIKDHNNKPVLFYHTTIVQPPADSPASYARSGFIHPVYSPNGKILTDDFPAGHAHQHAMFAAWTNTTFRKDFVDFWNTQLQKGTVEHVEVLRKKEGPIVTQLQVLLRYKSLAHGEVLKEKWTLNFYPFTGYYLFDLISEQVNTTKDTLFLNPYHYGGLAFRGSREWNPDDKTHFTSNWHILTSEGIKDTSANATHARWVDASGIVDGAPAGATVFDHPDNFRYPQAIRVHPSFPYWCYSPVIDGAFTIAPGQYYRSRYRYFLHAGSPAPAFINKIEMEWRTPPSVKVIGK
jgi:Methane oxygenase PmoA